MIEQYRILRGEILRALYRNLPHPVGDNLLATIFADTPTQIQGHLRYLADKGYVELKPVDDVARQYLTASLMASLTSLGVDLLEGSIPAEPGITLPPL